MHKDKIEQYIEETKGFTPEEIIKYAYDQFQEGLSFATSLGEEDQIILDMISKVSESINVFTLDTGRLFQETYDLLDKNQKRYSTKIYIYYPNTQKLEEMVKNKGINLFYDSVDNRKECCFVRKIEPLQRALNNKTAWITGLRRSQSITRATAQTFEWDEGNKMVKVNPLAFWSLDDVRKYIENNDLDVSPLHAKGFISIGCAPCTRAVKDGGDIRDGRWWWETPEQKECGLHLKKESPSNG